MAKFGRYHAPDPPSALLSFHLHQGGPLKTVDHEPKIAVLDQEDLLAQGIRCSTFIPGASDVDELGSCVYNTTIEALSNALSPADFSAKVIAQLGQSVPEASPYRDTVAAERAAITLYHAGTDQTGDPAQEWPPTDCGSSGVYAAQLLTRLKLISGQKIAHGADNIVSLLQSDGLLVGMPYLTAWMETDASGFIDGGGSTATLQAQIRQGIAGGHELYFSAIEKLVVLRTGQVDPFKTVLRFRNHWTPSWGDHGSGRIHLSTLVALGGQVDARQILA